MASPMWDNPGTPAAVGLTGCHPLLLALRNHLPPTPPAPADSPPQASCFCAPGLGHKEEPDREGPADQMVVASAGGCRGVHSPQETTEKQEARGSRPSSAALGPPSGPLLLLGLGVLIHLRRGQGNVAMTLGTSLPHSESPSFLRAAPGEGSYSDSGSGRSLLLCDRGLWGGRPLLPL